MRWSSCDGRGRKIRSLLDQDNSAKQLERKLGVPFDVVMDFGFKTPEQAKKQGIDYDIVARIAMSLSHAKSMLPILARVVAEYEKQVGTIPAPGFDDQSKG